MPLTLNDIDLPPTVEGKIHRGLSSFSFDIIY